MAIFTSYFVTSAAQLAEGFPDWKLPVPQPATLPCLHPLTGKLVQLPAWDLEEAITDSATVGQDKDVVRGHWLSRFVSWLRWVSSAGERRQMERYAAYMEERSHPLVRNSPHQCWKGLGSLELAPLYAILVGQETEEADFMLHPEFEPPAENGELLALVPPEMTVALAQLDRQACDTAAIAWRDSEPWSAGAHVSDVRSILTELVRLARVAIERGHNLYLMTEY